MHWSIIKQNTDAQADRTLPRRQISAHFAEAADRFDQNICERVGKSKPDTVKEGLRKFEGPKQ